MNKRLLIVSCSATKNEAPGLMPAIDRYQGAYYQMIHQVPVNERPEIIILSAEFGFISSSQPIPSYDRKMTKSRVADLLAKSCPFHAFDTLTQGGFDEIFVAAGHLYKRLITEALEQCPWKTGWVHQATGGIGHHRQQLKAWLAEGRP